MPAMRETVESPRSAIDVRCSRSGVINVPSNGAG